MDSDEKTLRFRVWPSSKPRNTSLPVSILEVNVVLLWINWKKQVIFLWNISSWKWLKTLPILKYSWSCFILFKAHFQAEDCNYGLFSLWVSSLSFSQSKQHFINFFLGRVMKSEFTAGEGVGAVGFLVESGAEGVCATLNFSSLHYPHRV